jgi:hypothetical protein
MYHSEVNNLYHPGQTIFVKSWWYKDERIIKCEVIKSWTSWMTYSDGIKYDEADFLEVKPLEGNIHTRWIRAHQVAD